MARFRRNRSAVLLTREDASRVFSRLLAHFPARSKDWLRYREDAVRRVIEEYTEKDKPALPAGRPVAGKGVAEHRIPYALVNFIAAEYEDAFAGSKDGRRELLQGFLAAADKKGQGAASVYLSDRAVQDMPGFLEEVAFDLEDRVRGTAEDRRQRARLEARGGDGGDARAFRAQQREAEALRAIPRVLRSFGSDSPLAHRNPRRAWI